MYYSTLVAFIPYKIRKRRAYGPFRKEKEKKKLLSYGKKKRLGTGSDKVQRNKIGRSLGLALLSIKVAYLDEDLDMTLVLPDKIILGVIGNWRRQRRISYPCRTRTT